MDHYDSNFEGDSTSEEEFLAELQEVADQVGGSFKTQIAKISSDHPEALCICINTIIDILEKTHKDMHDAETYLEKIDLLGAAFTLVYETTQANLGVLKSMYMTEKEKEKKAQEN